MDHLFHVQHWIDLYAVLPPLMEQATFWLRARF